jgi:hypothetical protein
MEVRAARVSQTLLLKDIRVERVSQTLLLKDIRVERVSQTLLLNRRTRSTCFSDTPVK